MKPPRSRSAIAAVMLVAALLAGCSGGGGGAAASTKATGDPVQGGSLTYLEPQAWLTLYPPAAGFYPNGGVVNNFTDRLLYQNPETLELEPWIATKYKVNKDATEYTFTLRDGVTYSDGSPLDAANVVRNFDLYGKGDEQRALTVSEAINNYERGKVVDERTVKFFFSAPAPGFAQAVSTINSGLLSNKTLDRSAEQFGPGNATEIIGSGPFVIEDEQLGTKLTLAARKDYDWAPPSLQRQGRALLDRVTYVVTAEDSVRVGTVVSGQAQIARQIEGPDEAQFKRDGLRLVAASTNGVNNGLSFRFRDEPLTDIRVRQALIAGIDRQTIIDTLFTDSYPLATGTLAKTALGYTDTSSYYEYDPARSKQLLDSAGWRPGQDGIREKGGKRLTLTFNEALPQPRSRELVTLVQEQLRELGVEVKLYPGDQAAQDAARGEVGTLQVYHSMVGRSDYDVIKSQYHSKNRNTLLNGRPDGSVGDREFDDLLLAVASAATEQGRQKASAAAQKRAAEQAYLLPFFEEPQVYGLTAAVQGFATESVGRPTFYSTWLAQ